jgi:hypothetical protein
MAALEVVFVQLIDVMACIRVSRKAGLDEFGGLPSCNSAFILNESKGKPALTVARKASKVEFSAAGLSQCARGKRREPVIISEEAMVTKGSWGNYYQIDVYRKTESGLTTATTTQSPEQTGVTLLGHSNEAAIGQHDFKSQDLVGSQSVFAGQR